MGKGFSLGKVFGIKIDIDWSWLFIFVLVSWNLTTAFGQMHPDWGWTLRIATSAAAALLFFASVLAHELAHSLVARSRGLPVRGITLFLFGGVSNIQKHPPSPAAEFLIAVVGPITSGVLGVIFLVLSGLGLAPMAQGMTDPTQLAAQLGPVRSLLLWLGPVNLILGVFNLIPGFPLDGGRILRSIFWKLTDNLRQATRWASWVGQTIAWLMIAGGIAMVFGAQVPFFGSGLINGLWLAFIGWFLNSAAISSYRQIVIQDVLEGVEVRRMMREQMPTVSRDASVEELVHNHIMKFDDHSFPVVDGDEFVGTVTLEDVREISREAWGGTRVDEIMTPGEDVVWVSSDEEAADAFTKLSRRDVRQLPVLDQGQLVGVLSRRDIVRWLQFQSDRAFGRNPMLG
jgi:Zn-dependent protease